MLTEPLFEETAYRTRERLGKEYRVSHATVDKYRIYANAIGYDQIIFDVQLDGSSYVYMDSSRTLLVQDSVRTPILRLPRRR